MSTKCKCTLCYENSYVSSKSRGCGRSVTQFAKDCENCKAVLTNPDYKADQRKSLFSSEPRCPNCCYLKEPKCGEKIPAINVLYPVRRIGECKCTEKDCTNCCYHHTVIAIDPSLRRNKWIAALTPKEITAVRLAVSKGYPIFTTDALFCNICFHIAFPDT
jgi:hypothetical protein